MKVFNTIEGIQNEVLKLRDDGKSIGFVPTMGALHEGHLSLLKYAIKECDATVTSIFVNPIQFNNERDLEKYPRTLDDDLKKLEITGCDLVFTPSAEEMYPDEVKEQYDFGRLERVMEGEHRPGHFNGVAVVVKRLFEICMPNRSYFGEKDFQQLMIIRSLTDKENLPVQIIGCPIIRESDGLAMSSRNVRLSSEERSYAPEIFKTLKWIREQRGKGNVEDILRDAEQKLNSFPGMKVEYIQIADEQSLEPRFDWSAHNNSRIFVATFLGDVRLIDNLKV